MRGRLPLPPFPGQTAGGGVPAAPRRLAPTSFPGLPPAETPAAAHSRANRRGRRPRHPAKACAVANNNPCLPPWGKVAPQGRMRGGLPLPLIPGQTVGAASPTPRGGLRRRPSPGYHPRRLPLPPTPAEGSRPLPTDRTIDGGLRNPPRAGHARPLPCGGPGTGVRVNPAGVSISPSVGRGAPTPPRPPAAANNSPCLPPWGKVAPQGRMRGRLPLPPFPGQTVGGGVPDAPRNLAPTPIPRTVTRGGVKTPPYGPNH